MFPLGLETITIGRDPLTDIVIDDPEVSRLHARLARTEQGYTLQDMGSTNGTFVEGQRLGGEPVALEPGQVVILGSNVTFAYEAATGVDLPAPIDRAEMEMPAAEPDAEGDPDFSGEAIGEEGPGDMPEPVAAEVPPLTTPLGDLPSEPIEDEDEPAAFEPAPHDEPALFDVEPDEGEDQGEPVEIEVPAAGDEPVGMAMMLDEPEPPTLYPSFSEPATGTERGPMPPLEEAGLPPLYDSGAPSDLLESEPAAPRRPVAEVIDGPAVKRDNTARNVVIAVAAVILLCCCLALAVAIAVIPSFVVTGTP